MPLSLRVIVPALMLGVVFAGSLAAQTGGADFRGRVRNRNTPTTEAQPLLPWLRLQPETGLDLQFHNELTWNPTSGTVTLEIAEWNVSNLQLAVFGGEAGLLGSGRVAGTQLDSIATTVTMRALDLNALLNFMEVPRADEIHARLTGSLRLTATDRQWQAIAVNVAGDPGTVRIHRKMLLSLFSFIPENESLTQQDFIDTLDQNFRGNQWVPLENAYINGALGEKLLILTINLPIPDLNITMPVILDRALIWDIWDSFQQSGLKNLEQVDFK